MASKLSRDDIRELAENDLLVFAKLVNPNREYGAIHETLFRWWTREGASDNQLCLLPRDHQKSHCIAVRAAWEITRNPDTTILYVSATAALAEKQLYAIKNILTSSVYRRYWPDMTNPDEGKRERWTTTEISVDHPKRKLEGVRDSTVLAAGITANVTGFHCNIAILDDLVVPGNAYTKEGRRKVEALYSQLASIETSDSQEWVVGTRYEPRDLYSTLIEIEEDVFDDETGEVTSSRKVYEVFEKVVENSEDRDGTGKFIWPRQRRKDGRFFGFNKTVLARKRAKYVDREQYFAQYYNDPNDRSTAPVQAEWIQYFDKKYVTQTDGTWYYKDKRLNVIAAMDFAFSTRKTADYTAIVIIGIDSDNNIYVLDVDRFRTDKISTMFDRLLVMHNKWDFRKLRAEVSVAQQAIVNEFRNYMKQYGVYFSIDEYRPSRHEGTKEERMDSVLTPRYENLAIWHYKGGYCQVLEDEVLASRPPHDDIKDALANAIAIARPPMQRMRRTGGTNVVQAGSRFGGF